MNILGDAPRYRAYLLRCWAEHGQDAITSLTWRYSLEDPHTGERRGFPTLAAMVAFLEVAMAPGRETRTATGANE